MPPVHHAAPPLARRGAVASGLCDAGRVTSAGRIYAGRSPEDRREERRARLLAAGLELIGEDGIAAVSVRGVCGRAGLTPRYFYEEFGSVDELARQLFDREFDAGMARVAQAVAALDAARADADEAGGDAGAETDWRVRAVGDQASGDAGGDTEPRVRAAVGAVLEFLTESPHRSALLLTQASGGGLLAQRRQERMDDIVALVTAFARTTYGTGEPPPAEIQEESDRALRSAATFVAGGLAQTVDAWIHGQITGPQDLLRDDLAAQILAVGDTASARLDARLVR